MDEKPRPYHHGTVKESALVEGQALLKEVGVERFSLREIARRLGVTPTALYHYFPDKSDLLQALAEQGLKEFQDLLFQVPRNGHDPAYLTAIARNYIRFFREKPYYLNLIFSHHFKVEGRLLDNRQNMFQFLIDILTDQGIAPDQAPTLGVWLWAAVHGLTTMIDTGILGIEDNVCTEAPAKAVFHTTADGMVEDLLPILGTMIQNMHPKSS